MPSSEPTLGEVYNRIAVLIQTGKYHPSLPLSSILKPEELPSDPDAS